MRSSSTNLRSLVMPYRLNGQWTLSVSAPYSAHPKVPKMQVWNVRQLHCELGSESSTFEETTRSAAVTT
jgi:hypothetical protein